MSKKYVIEMKSEYEDTIRGIMVLGARDSNLYMDALAVEDMEELNSDYINEYFGDLQDTAYRRGFEDGKAVNDKGCKGCKYAGKVVTGPPCITCCNSYKNQWTAKKTDDKIEVGDEVDVDGSVNDGMNGIVTKIFNNDYFYIMWSDGSGGAWHREHIVKTGRRFDIEKVLEAMKA